MTLTFLQCKYFLCQLNLPHTWVGKVRGNCNYIIIVTSIPNNHDWVCREVTEVTCTVNRVYKWVQK